MLDLRPQETVFYPTPYIEGEVVPLVITSQRVIQAEGDVRREVEATKITYTGRQSGRPYILLGIFILLSVLGPIGYAGWRYWSVRGMPSFKEAPPAVEDPEYEDPKWVRIEAYVVGGLSLLWGYFGFWLCRRKRTLVVCQVQGLEYMVKLRAKDKNEQTHILMTIQATINGAKATIQAAKDAAKARNS